MALMRYAVTFFAVSVGFGVLAWRLGGVAWVLLWPSLAFFLAAVAYAGGGARVFGKTPVGSIRLLHLALLLPFLSFTWGVWHAARAVGGRPCANEVGPGLWLGRRPLCAEPPPGAIVVDLTAEFTAAVDRSHVAGYRCLPTLDATAPEPQSVLELVRDLVDETRPVFVHCASGFGRSAMVAAALLIARGMAHDADAAEKHLRMHRRGVRLTGSQRRILRELTPELNRLAEAYGACKVPSTMQ